MYKMLGSAIWVSSAVVCVGVGASALGLNLLGMLHFEHLQMYVHYAAGALGVLSLSMFVMQRMDKCAQCGCSGSNCK